MTHRCTVLVLLLVAAPAWGATYFTRPGGADSHTCTQAMTDQDGFAKASVQAAIDCLTPSDTVLVHGGTYREAPVLRGAASGSEGAPTAVRAITGESVWLAPTAGNAAGAVLWNYADYTIIEGINLDGAGIANTSNLLFTGNNDGVTKNHDITYQHLEVKNLNGTGSACVTGTGLAHHITYRDVHVHHCGLNLPASSPGEHCLYVSASDVLVEDSEFDHCRTIGIQAYPSPQRTVLRRNHIHDTGSHGILVIGDNAAEVHHNVIEWAGDLGGYGSPGGVFVRGNNTKILHNTLVGGTGPGVLVESGSGIAASNNILWLNGSDLTGPMNASHNLCNVNSNGCLGGDPLFVVPNLDYHLQPGSPAIDLGTVVSPCPGSMTCAHTGSAPDAGAFEAGSTPQPPEVVHVPYGSAVLTWDWAPGPPPNDGQVETWQITCGSESGGAGFSDTQAGAGIRSRPIALFLPAPGEYFCRVYAANAAGVSEASPEVHFVATTAPPVAPHTLTVSATREGAAGG